MLVKIKATPKAIVTVNAIIEQGLKTIQENPALAKYFDCNDKVAEEVENFRKAMAKSYAKQLKKITTFNL